MARKCKNESLLSRIAIYPDTNKFADISIHKYRADDFAFNKGLLVQPELLERLWKPHFERIMLPAIDAGIPVTNYGMAIAYVQGIYHRAIAPFINTQNIS